MDDGDQLFGAIRSGDDDAFGRILASDPQAGLARDEHGVSAVLMAAYYRREKMIAAILAKGIPLDIWEASATGKTARVRELVRRAPSLVDAVAPDGYSPLGLAAFFGREDTVEFLLESGADVNARSRNAMGVAPLHSAVAAPNLRIVTALLEAGAGVNAVQQGGFTPLHGAAFNGDAAIVKVLLESGADPTLKTDEGKRAIEIAGEKNFAAIVSLLTPGR